MDININEPFKKIETKTAIKAFLHKFDKAYKVFEMDGTAKFVRVYYS